MPFHRNTPWAAAAIAIVALGVVGCRQVVREPENGSGNEVQPPRSPLPVAEAPLNRADLLAAVAKAASATSLGADDSGAQRGLDGDRFELRIRVGCPGWVAPDDGADFEQRYESETRTLRLRAKPDLTNADSTVAELAGEAVEAVEGFWLPRPWMLTAGCPKVASVAQESVTPNDAEKSPGEAARTSPTASPRVGIAQFFTASDPRTGRRNQRAFEATKVLGDSEQPSAAGYDLVLSGRLAQLADGRVIACRALRANTAPDCIVAANIDSVRLERGDTKAVLAEWDR